MIISLRERKTPMSEHRQMALDALRDANERFLRLTPGDDRTEPTLLAIGERLEALTHAVLYVGDQLARDGHTE
ncbi:hypothetical protein AB0B45_02505 [Nonomuraea sp. NPDC049152]|uniref:hypothetical protein n=1 Tax=Nonomuraea sp. NPDC049152 TaxID=3154350 RepID=UPI0033CDB948